MKKIKPIILFIFGSITFVLGAFMSMPVAHATEQTINTTSVATTGSGNFTQWGGQYLGTGLTDEFSALTLYGTFPSGAGLQVKICEGTSESSFYGMGTGEMVCPTTKATGTLDIETNAEQFTITLDQTVSMTADKHYAIKLYIDNKYNCVIYGTDTDSDYSGGTFGSYGYQSNYPQFFRTYTDPVKDIYFILGTGNPYALSFQTPEQSETISGDFPYWALNVDAPELSGNNWYYISVQYEYDGTAFSDGQYTYGGDALVLGIPKGFNLVAEGEWSALATMFDAPNGILGDTLATAEITFTVENPDLTPPVVECEEGDLVCQIGSWFAQKLYDIQVFLFAPRGETLDDFRNIWERVKTRVPFGYLELVQEQVDVLFDGGSGDYEIPEMGILTTIKDIIGYVLWVLFAVWVIKRIDKLEI